MNNFEQKILLRSKMIDISTGYPWIIALSEPDARRYGIRAGDTLLLKWRHHSTAVSVDLTTSLVKPGQVGLFREIKRQYKIPHDELIEFKLLEHPISLKVIQKKLLDKKLTYQEIFGVIRDIVRHRIDDISIAFFVSSFFFKKPSLQEIYYLTKAMAETGYLFKFKGRVVDKHSTGGLPGNRVTPIILPIIGVFGLTMPKTSSRAVTSAAGTADTFEVLAPVYFSAKQVERLIKKHKICLVWGSKEIAPADDRIIRVAYHLTIEPFSKMVVSIMAKKVAMGIKYLVVDIPVNPTAKVNSLREAKKIRSLFLYLARKFKIKTEVTINFAADPVGRGVGPALEARDILRVLEQKKNRPFDLERKSVKLAGRLLELSGKVKRGEGKKKAREVLKRGLAWKKMQEIIKAQGGNPNIDSEGLSQGKIVFEVKAGKRGVVNSIQNQNLVEICRLLGAPFIKKAGIYLNKSVGDRIKKGETLFTLYTVSQLRMNLAKEGLKKLKIYYIS
ncbi:thymidine phosphorylase [bacterium (Candidatus Moisslbacteria) CG_4_10_14_0_2_um_filter_36_61]|nr:MAG: thymidine phosphorylase [bacterium (Candidatus Moisslbacteria) CG_4_10_14_0_2_um_filter_36_61]